MDRLHVIAIAAGMVHSLALSDDGSLFYWASSDSDLRCQQLYSMCGKSLVSITAGKYWVAAASATGDIHMWDGKKGKGEPPVTTRLHGVKRATSVSVGETHLLIVSALYHPVYPPKPAEIHVNPKLETGDEFEDGFMFDDMQDTNMLMASQADRGKRPVPSLKSLCERVAAESLVEPRIAIQLLEIADSMGADELRNYCEDIATRNLDYIFTVSPQAIASASLDILAKLEKVLDAKSSEPWSHRRLPTPTATLPAVIYSEEEDNDTESPRVRDNRSNPALKMYAFKRSNNFLQVKDAPEQVICKQIRALRKKLQQIEMLEEKQASGHLLDDQQIAKLQTRSALEFSLGELGVPVERQDRPSSPALLDSKGSKKLDASKKQRKKKKSTAAQSVKESEHNNGESYPIKGFLEGEISQVPKQKGVEPSPVKGFLDGEFSQVSKQRDRGKDVGGTQKSEILDESSVFKVKKEVQDSLSNSCKTSSQTANKKKNRKCGLSLFLSGALDDLPKEVAPPPPPTKIEGPAWGGAKILKGPASLRDIQNEESKTKKSEPSKRVNIPKEDAEKVDGRVPLSSFLPVVGQSFPIAVASSCMPRASLGWRRDFSYPK